MKKTRKLQFWIWISAFLPLILVGSVYHRLPAKIPMQWQAGGGIRYDDKWEIWLVAALPLFLAALFALLPKLDPKRKSYAKFRGSYQAFQLFMMVFLLIMVAVIIVESFWPSTVDMMMLLCLLCGLLFLVIGNMMPKFRPNWFCGIRTPWTLSSETVWVRTHRLGGRLFFGAGVLTMLGAVVPHDAVRLTLSIVPVLLAALVSAVQSYRWYRQETQTSA